MTVVVNVSIYSDYTCPWCYVGAARIERLKHALPKDVTLRETWMPFEIHPEVPDEGMPVADLPYSEDQFKDMMAYLQGQAAEEGLKMTARTKLSNTHRALAAGTYVQKEHVEEFPAFHFGLFKAYFEKGLDLNDLSVIRQAALDARVDPDAVADAVVSGAYDDAIAATGEMARRLGITGTPTFVFENEFAVVGAHPVETLREAVMEVVEKKTPVSSPSE